MKEILILVLFLAALLGVISWVYLRPNQVRRDCYKEAWGRAYTGMNSAVVDPNATSEKAYSACLNEHGLEK
jgi:hypothetical protein